MPSLDPRRGSAAMTLTERVECLDWATIEQSLWERGYAESPSLLTPDECVQTAALFDDSECFRSTVNMAKHGYGVGLYKYFSYPLPPIVAELRTALYAGLASAATRWAEACGLETSFPASLEAFTDICDSAGQMRPTPLLLRYEQGGYNCLHQDLYGEIWFPFQAVVLLSSPGDDFTGGEFLLVEQRPRSQSVGHVIQPRQGAMIIIATRHRPARGARGYYRTTLRHGVSQLHSGRRSTLGIIFHDAQ